MWEAVWIKCRLCEYFKPAYTSWITSVWHRDTHSWNLTEASSDSTRGLHEWNQLVHIIHLYIQKIFRYSKLTSIPSDENIISIRREILLKFQRERKWTKFPHSWKYIASQRVYIQKWNLLFLLWSKARTIILRLGQIFEEQWKSSRFYPWPKNFSDFFLNFFSEILSEFVRILAALS